MHWEVGDGVKEGFLNNSCHPPCAINIGCEGALHLGLGPITSPLKGPHIALLESRLLEKQDRIFGFDKETQKEMEVSVSFIGIDAINIEP